MTNYKYCPECTAELGTSEDNYPACPNGHFTKYPTPVASSMGFVRNNGEYLLTKRAREPRKGFWGFPGGFVEPGESGLEAVIREIKEETGLAVEMITFLGTYPSIYGDTGEHTLAVTYIFESKSREVTLSEENNEYRWCALDELPELAFEDCKTAVEDLRKLAL